MEIGAHYVRARGLNFISARLRFLYAATSLFSKLGVKAGGRECKSGAQRYSIGTKGDRERMTECVHFVL